MSRKPTYGELARRVRTLEQEAAQHRRAYLSLKQCEARHRRLIHDSPLGILTINRRGRIVETNPKILEIIGAPADTATKGVNIFDLPQLIQAGIAADFRQCLETGKPVVADHPFTTKWGKAVHLHYHLTPITSPRGKVIGVQSVHEDFTKIKAAELALHTHREHLEKEFRLRTQKLTRTNRQLTQRVKKLEGRANAIMQLNELSELLQACDCEEETYQAVAQTAQQLFPSDSGFLSILDRSYKVLRIMSGWGTYAEDRREFEYNGCWSIRRGKVHVVNGPQSGPLCGHLNGKPDWGYLCAPMNAQGEVLGMLHLTQGGEGGPGTTGTGDQGQPLEVKRLLAVGMVERYASRLTNIRLKEKLKIQSIRDPLTDLYNRRHMQVCLHRETLRARRHGTGLGIIIIDIDHFKTFNDLSGHEAGDKVLRQLGHFLQKYTRGEDIACRFGGDEFSLIMPDASLDNTCRRAEELRRGVKAKLGLSLDGERQQITISLGVAVFPDHGSCADDVLNAADGALLRAKGAGRNRVMVSPKEDPAQQE